MLPSDQILASIEPQACDSSPQMDPLSITTGIITIVQAVLGTLNVLVVLRGAPAEIKDLIQDISDFEAILRTIDQASRGQGLHLPQAQEGYSAVQKLLTKARNKVLELQQIFSGCVAPNCSKNAWKFARLQWLQERSRVKAIQQDLQAIKLDIVSLWGAIASYVAPPRAPVMMTH